MMQFMAKQNTACSDASACAPAACAASACTADTAVICKDTAILAVSIFISLIMITITIGLGGLLISLLVWALVAVKFHSTPNSNVFAARKRTAA